MWDCSTDGRESNKAPLGSSICQPLPKSIRTPREQTSTKTENLTKCPRTDCLGEITEQHLKNRAHGPGRWASSSLLGDRWKARLDGSAPAPNGGGGCLGLQGPAH